MDSTAFTELSTLASPLDHVFRHVPKAHEKALRQAVYNIIAAATFGGICFAAYYVLVVLEPFIMPMFWAVMTGFVIHPYKTQCADILRSQLQWLGNSETPASLMILSSSITAIDKVFDHIGGRIMASWKLIFILVLSLISSYYIVAVIAFQPLIEAFCYWITPVTVMINCFQNLEISHLLVVIVGYLTIVFFFWDPQKAILFQIASSFIWLLVLGFALNTSWAPFIYAFVAIAIYARGWKIGRKSDTSSTNDSGQSTPDTEMDGVKKTNTKFRKAVFSILKSLQDPRRCKLKDGIATESENDTMDCAPNEMNKHVVTSPPIEEEKESFTDSEALEESINESNEREQSNSSINKNEMTADDELYSHSLVKKESEDSFQEKKEPIDDDKGSKQTVGSHCKQEEEKMPHPGVAALKMQHLGSKKLHTPGFPQNISHLHCPSEAGGKGSTITNTPHLYTSTPGIRTTNTGLRTTRFAEKARTTIIRRRFSNTIRTRHSDKEEDENESSFYLSWVARSCVVLQLWFHPVLLELLPIPILYCITKWIFSKFDLLDPLLSWAQEIKQHILALMQERSDALAPRPVRSIWFQLYKLEKKILIAAPEYTDVIVTALLIVACNTFVICFIFYVTFQLYTESVVLMELSSTVMSKITHTSLYQNINETIVGKCVDSGVEACAYVLPSSNYSTNVDQLVESAYQYGRNYISSAITSFLRDNSDNSHQDAQLDQFENQVLELWDRIYQYWLNKNNQQEHISQENIVDNHTDEVFGPKVTSDAVTSSMEDLFSGMLNVSVPTRVFGNAMNFSMFSQFAMNNIGTMTSVLEQGWVLIKGNIGLVFTVIAECLRILMSGGSGMVNFCLSLIVYFTALFYLLRSKDPIYKPIEVISNHGQLLGSGFASALEKAVNGVFTLTVKMVCFYGMWTYLTHKLFAVSLVTLPVLAAAFLAAVPVAGQYVVAIPAALELWLAESRWFAAILIILAHMIPTYVVDAAIYSEARQDIHPWITGLSIIGGVYWCGVPGAIYGPLLLCAVYVILSMYTSLLKEIPLEANTLQRTAGMERRSKIGQSLLCGIGSKSSHQTPILKRSDSVF